MQNTPKVMIRHSKKAGLLLSSLLAASLSAQTAPDIKPADDSVIELSPFAVTTDKDQGYKASNSIGGTRSNTAIKDISLNIQVFTKDLADDLIIADQTQLERYNAALVNGNADAQSDAVIQQAYGAFLFRGFVQNWGMRDGVREYDPVDSIGIARVEVVKGPAAALYGLSYAGGIMNTITKRADMTKNFVSLRATVTGQGGQRGTVDANVAGKLGDGVKAAIRYAGAAAITQDKREHSEGKTRYNQINFQLDPTSTTELQLLVENQWRQRPNGLGYYSLNWDQTGATGPLGTRYASKVTGIGAQVPLQVLRPEIPWTWNWATVSNPRALETSMYRFTVNQAIGDNLHVTAYVQNNQRRQPDSQGWDDGGNSQNGAGWDVGVASGWMNNSSGQEVIRRYYHWRDWTDLDHSQGVTAVYKFDAGPIKNTVTAGWAHWDERFTSHKYLDNVNAWDLPVTAGISTQAAPEPANYTLQSPAGNREHNQNSYEFIAWQVAAIDNRLKANFAINRTHIKNLIWPNVSSNDPYNAKVDMSKNSPMVGLMFDITKEISVFAVHSTSLFPTTDKNDELTVQMPPEVGKSNEVGVKVELLNGKISGTASVYKIKKTGGGVRDIHAENANKLRWDQYRALDGWTTIDSLGWSHDRDQIRSSADGRTGNLGNIVPAELESKGFEADLVIQPIKTLQFVVSYAHNSEESVAGTTKGQSNGGHIKDQLAGLVKYTFDEGAVKGLFLGLGYQFSGKSTADYISDAAGVSVERFTPSTFNLEFFSGYKFKAFGVNQVIQLNVKNLTRQDEYFGWVSTTAGQVATERYKIPTYVTFSVTYGLDF
jgi:outer membrane receptor protein involved in Fe transport